MRIKKLIPESSIVARYGYLNYTLILNGMYYNLALWFGMCAYRNERFVCVFIYSHLGFTAAVRTIPAIDISNVK